MEEKILNELREIKKELQDIHSILEPKKNNVFINNHILKKFKSHVNTNESIENKALETQLDMAYPLKYSKRKK